MNQAVAVLAERGLIRRSPDDDNRRKRRIELTDLGRRVVGECSAAVDEFEEQLLGALAPDAREELNRLLRTVVHANRVHKGAHRTKATAPAAT
jgi:DNA-binding MarR family transcriptional regulator